MIKEKRKRSKRAGAKSEPEKKKPAITEENIAAAHRFVERQVAPRILANTARRLGARKARPRDFYCDCIQSFLDGLPICEGEKPGCRFAKRVKTAEMEAHLSDAAEAHYMVLYRTELNRRRSKPFRTPA
ncbi:hypothetical protein PUV54_13760 [Hyphococcus flavus]|uniref:Uncharacterized protein n=1 Tax=Hyphococcus flavus TaxID=1866326 RepID=A0AAE9ZIM3_9PROT|nr:hypothetical protein [Hyphococcus flavus]WDI31020.1 hypothetical protein PUV54_13760 [Hyphococcus flavus]